MKTTLLNIINRINYVAPGPAVSIGPGSSSLTETKKHRRSKLTCEELAGIDISDGLICATYLTRSEHGAIQLQHAGWARYDYNESPESLSLKIKHLWKECGIPMHLVTTCLHTRSLAIKHLKYTGLSHNDLYSALQLEAEEALQLPPNELVFDWHTNRTDGAPNTPVTSGLLVSAPTRKITRLVNTLRNAGLYPAVIDTAPTAISNLYLTLNGNLPKGESRALLTFSSHNAVICILYEGDQLYARSIFSHSGSWNDNADYLIETLQDALLYYQVKINKDPITKILLTGDVPQEAEFIEKIRVRTELPITLWNPLSDPMIDVSKKCQSDLLTLTSPSQLATSLGLALRREATHD